MYHIFYTGSSSRLCGNKYCSYSEPVIISVPNYVFFNSCITFFCQDGSGYLKLNKYKFILLCRNETLVVQV